MESKLGLPILLPATQWPTNLLIAAFCASFWLITRHAFRVNIAPGEPVLLSSRVPLLGHLLGMLASGSGYYMSLFRKTGHELQAATLSIFGHKVYVIFSPSLAQAALRNRDLSFEPFVVLASHALANLEGRSLKLLRHRVFRSLGFNDSEIGRMELTMVFASTNNSVPLIFWIIVNVFARPGVVETLRAEVQGVVDIVPVKEEQEAVGKSGGKTATLRQANVRASLLTDEARCPYLAAIQREVLRLCNTTTEFRHAMRDTTLPDGTFLQAGSTVHIPTSISHRLPEVWGPADPNEFEPARWIKTTPGTNGLIKAPAAYFPFGGGKHLCPPRTELCMR